LQRPSTTPQTKKFYTPSLIPSILQSLSCGSTNWTRSYHHSLTLSCRYGSFISIFVFGTIGCSLYVDSQCQLIALCIVCGYSHFSALTMFHVSIRTLLVRRTQRHPLESRSHRVSPCRALRRAPDRRGVGGQGSWEVSQPPQ
jgi:hypothetical protein